MDVDRITKNEERLDKISLELKKLEKELESFKEMKKELNYLNKYYGSKNWFKDKEDFEKEKKPKIKAGVLSEDAVWNLNEELDELILDMKEIVNNYKR